MLSKQLDVWFDRLSPANIKILELEGWLGSGIFTPERTLSLAHTFSAPAPPGHPVYGLTKCRGLHTQLCSCGAAAHCVPCLEPWQAHAGASDGRAHAGTRNACADKAKLRRASSGAPRRDPCAMSPSAMSSSRCWTPRCGPSAMSSDCGQLPATDDLLGQ